MSKLALVARRTDGAKASDVRPKRVRPKAIKAKQAKAVTLSPATLSVEAVVAISRQDLTLANEAMKKALAAGDMRAACDQSASAHYLMGAIDALCGSEDLTREIATDLEAGHRALARLSKSSRSDKTIRELQSTLPWTIHYHRDFRASPMTHKDFGHALLHVFKAAGKLAALVNDAEHGGCEFKAAQTDPYVADLVVCALRMANTCPGRTIDLQHAVVARIEKKNDVKL